MAIIRLLKTAKQIVDDIILPVLAPIITDPNIGAVMRTIAYAFGLALEAHFLQLYTSQRSFYIKTAEGEALRLRALDYGIAKYDAQAAIGSVRFTGPDPAPGNVSIPAGTLVAVPATVTSDEIVFVTTATVQLLAGNTTVDAPIQAQQTGTVGNVGQNTITLMKTTVAGISSVTNPGATVLGRAIETDHELRERILRTLEGLSRGTVPSLKHGAVDFEIQQVTLARKLPAGQAYLEVEEDLNLIPISAAGGKIGINNNTEICQFTSVNTSTDPMRLTGLTRAQDGTSDQDHELGLRVREYIPTSRSAKVISAYIKEDYLNGHVDIYVDTGELTPPDANLIAVLKKRLEGDGTDRDPGYRGGGITLNVLPITINNVDITASVVIAFDAKWSTVQAALNTAVANLINQHKAGINLEEDEVFATIMGVDGVVSINSLVIDGVTFNNSGGATVTVAPYEAVRPGSFSFTN